MTVPVASGACLLGMWLALGASPLRAAGATPSIPAEAEDADAGSGPRAPRVELTVVADEPCAPQLRAVLAEQLADVAGEVAWSCRATFDEEDLFRAGPRARPRGETTVRIWIDISTPTDARVYLEDERSERFVIRRLPLAHGLDEISREELGQIARSGTLAVVGGRSETLTRAQVRSTLSAWPARRPAADTPHLRATASGPPTPAPAPPTPPPVVELGPAWSVQALSRALPLGQEIALGLSVRPPTWALFGWTEVGLRVPATVDAQPVDVKLGAVAGRLGVGYRRPLAGRASWGVGAGIGLNRWSFAAGRASTPVDTAPAGAFFAVTGRALFALELGVATRMTAGLRLFCDVATADVHYDYRDAAGVSHRLLTPWAVMPGAGVVLTWRSSNTVQR